MGRKKETPVEEVKPVEVAEEVTKITPEMLEQLSGGIVENFSYGLGEMLLMNDIENRIFYLDEEVDEDIHRSQAQLEYVVDAQNKKIIRVKTADINYELGLKYEFTLFDLSSGKSSTYKIGVNPESPEIRLPRHFYQFKERNNPPKCIIEAKGIAHIYYKEQNKDYLHEIVKTNEGYIYTPQNFEEQVEIYFKIKEDGQEELFGEKLYIFPYEENARMVFNSSTLYDLPVLKYYAEPLLHEIAETSPAYEKAQQLLKFLENIKALTPAEIAVIPPTSIMREFIGGQKLW